MRVTVKKWGNSASVRIPSAIMEAAKIELNEQLEMREEDGRIVLEPIHAPSFDLDALLDGVTPENIHQEVDFGEPVGKESL